jgi:hypothetical protein
MRWDAMRCSCWIDGVLSISRRRPVLYAFLRWLYPNARSNGPTSPDPIWIPHIDRLRNAGMVTYGHCLLRPQSHSRKREERMQVIRFDRRAELHLCGLAASHTPPLWVWIEGHLSQTKLSPHFGLDMHEHVSQLVPWLNALVSCAHSVPVATMFLGYGESPG